VKAVVGSDEVRSAAAAAGAWLDASAANLSDGSLADSMRAAIGSVVATDAGAPSRRKALDMALERTRVCSLDQLAACGGPLVLLFCLAASRGGAALDGSLARFVDIAATALEENQLASADACASACLVAQLRGQTSRYGADPSAAQPVEDVAGVECATRFGTRRIAASPALAVGLEGVAMSRLRRYDFELGCRAARASQYAGIGASLGLATALAFLRAQQDFDGGFGFFDREAAESRSESEADRGASEFKVPATLACLWTLAECCSADYRVFRDIGRAIPSVSSEPP